MKKTIKKADGSEVTIEGTPEEISEYERQIKGEVKEEQKKGPGLLTEEQLQFKFYYSSCDPSCAACHPQQIGQGWFSSTRCTCPQTCYRRVVQDYYDNFTPYNGTVTYTAPPVKYEFPEIVSIPTIWIDNTLKG